jgi:hypothetical protein
MPEVSREERQSIVWIDARLVPLQNTVHDHRVAQIMNAWPGAPLQRLQPGAPNDVNKQPGDNFRCVTASAALLVPEQSGTWMLRRARIARAQRVSGWSPAARCAALST